MGEGRDPAHLPKVFFVNWFRKGEDGRFLWPGFGDNVRVLDWIVRRLENEVEAETTPIGLTPKPGQIDTGGLTLSDEAMDTLLGVDVEVWREEAGLIPAFFDRFGERLPKALWDQHVALKRRLDEAESARIAAE